MATTKRYDPLETAKLIAQGVKKGPVKQTAKRSTKPASGGTTDMVTTGLHIRKDHLKLLRRAAVGRADAQGGRSSVSAVLGDLIERHRAELERAAEQ